MLISKLYPNKLSYFASNANLLGCFAATETVAVIARCHVTCMPYTSVGGVESSNLNVNLLEKLRPKSGIFRSSITITRTCTTYTGPFNSRDFDSCDLLCYFEGSEIIQKYVNYRRSEVASHFEWYYAITQKQRMPSCHHDD